MSGELMDIKPQEAFRVSHVCLCHQLNGSYSIISLSSPIYNAGMCKCFCGSSAALQDKYRKRREDGTKIND